MSTSSSLPIDLRKQIGRVCVYSGCAAAADPDSDYCAPHEAHERGRDAKKKRRRRERLAKSGQCVNGCGRRVSAKMKRGRRGRGAKVKMLCCSTCSKLQKKRMADQRAKTRAVPDGGGAVPGEPSDPHWRVESDLRPERAGQTTKRYVGKSHRGRLSREEQIVEDQRDARFAIGYLEEFIRAADVLKREDVQALPAVQREAAHREAAQFPSSAARICDDLAERYGGE